MAFQIIRIEQCKDLLQGSWLETCHHTMEMALPLLLVNAQQKREVQDNVIFQENLLVKAAQDHLHEKSATNSFIRYARQFSIKQKASITQWFKKHHGWVVSFV